jgi:hypothetical protein
VAAFQIVSSDVGFESLPHGHTSVSTTLSVYAALIPNMQADAAAGVDKWLRNALAEQLGDKSWQLLILMRTAAT